MREAIEVRALSASICRWASAIAVPGDSRASICQLLLWRRSSLRSAGWKAAGVHSCTSSETKRKSTGITPTTVWTTPLTRSVWPMADGCPAKCRCHSRS